MSPTLGYDDTETSYLLFSDDEETGQWPHQLCIEFQTNVLKLIVAGNVPSHAITPLYWVDALGL